MHLTPGFLTSLRTLRDHVGLIGLLLLAAACSRRSQESAPLPTPAPHVADSTVPPRVTSRALSADSADYTLSSQVITIEVTATSEVTDTLVLEETVHVALTPASTGGFQITLTSDSGYVTAPDRLPPPETLRALRGPLELRVSLSPARDLRVHPSNPPDTCSPSLSLVSPLLSTTISWFIVQTVSQDLPSTSISYSTCSAGVVRQHQLTVRADSATTGSLGIRLAGSIHTDSSRALPMTIQGTLRGNGTALPLSGSAVLPARIVLDVTVDLLASAGMIRQQRFRQETHIRLERMP